MFINLPQPLEGVHEIRSGNGLALGMLSVGGRVTDDVLEAIDLANANNI